MTDSRMVADDVKNEMCWWTSIGEIDLCVVLGQPANCDLSQYITFTVEQDNTVYLLQMTDRAGGTGTIWMYSDNELTKKYDIRFMDWGESGPIKMEMAYSQPITRASNGCFYIHDQEQLFIYQRGGDEQPQILSGKTLAIRGDETYAYRLVPQQSVLRSLEGKDVQESYYLIEKRQYTDSTCEVISDRKERLSDTPAHPYFQRYLMAHMQSDFLYILDTYTGHVMAYLLDRDGGRGMVSDDHRSTFLKHAKALEECVKCLNENSVAVFCGDRFYLWDRTTTIIKIYQYTEKEEGDHHA